MQFILTNLNGETKRDPRGRIVNKGFCAPRSYSHESEHAVSIIKESTNVKGLLLWDGKDVWVSVPFVEQKEFRTALGAAAKSLKITEKNKANGSEQAQRQNPSQAQFRYRWADRPQLSRSLASASDSTSAGARDPGEV